MEFIRALFLLKIANWDAWSTSWYGTQRISFLIGKSFNMTFPSLPDKRQEEMLLINSVSLNNLISITNCTIDKAGNTSSKKLFALLFSNSSSNYLEASLSTINGVFHK